MFFLLVMLLFFRPLFHPPRVEAQTLRLVTVEVHTYLACVSYFIPGIVCLTETICLWLKDAETLKGRHHPHWHRNASNQHQHKEVMIAETDHAKTSSIRQELSQFFPFFLTKKRGKLRGKATGRRVFDTNQWPYTQNVRVYRGRGNRKFVAYGISARLLTCFFLRRRVLTTAGLLSH